MSEEYNYYRLSQLTTLAATREPGYLDYVKAVGIPVTRDGLVLGYKLTKDQTLEIKERFNPADAAGIEAQKARVADYHKMQSTLKLRSAEIATWVSQVLEPGTPCKFGGCEELKRALDAELLTLGDNCTNCQVGRVEGQFKTIIQKLWNDHDADTDNPPPLTAVLAAVANLHHVVVHDGPASAPDADAAPDWAPQQ